LLENLIIVPLDEYEDKIDEAMEIIGKIDEKDIQFVALALSIKNDGIWSNDKHFEKQEKVQIYKTANIIKFLEKKIEKESKKNYKDNL
jgi:predicted nucleic acid-binding protein